MIALITGITGQDGAYLSRFLLNKGYEVYGTSRDAQISSFKNLAYLGIRDKVKTESMAINDFRSVLQVLTKIRPDEIYNLAGQSSVGLSFEQPVETLESVSIGSLNLLEAIRFIGLPVRLYNACSSECFGDTGKKAADETTPFHPRSPYAVAKATSFWEVANYREAYGLFACSGILFNHESPLRPERFVTRKITTAACRMALGNEEKLRLGNISISRDWGYAPEYVEAMWLMLQQEAPDDYIIATGEAHSVREFIEIAFGHVGLDIVWEGKGIEEKGRDGKSGKTLIELSTELMRPADVDFLVGNYSKAEERLGWKPRARFEDVVKIMVDSDMSTVRESLKR
jgi:GDPmannose 4,6-dehydratase